MPRWDLIGAVAAALLVSSPALACKGKEVLLEDNFATTDPAWPIDSEIAIGNGTFRLTPNRGENHMALYSAQDFGDVDVCVTVTVPAGVDFDSSSAGIVFWADDEDSFYYYKMYGDGQVEVQRLSEGRWLIPVKARDVDNVDAAAGSKHTLRITLQSTKATLYLDDIKVVDFNGQLSRAHSFIGLAAESSDKRRDAWSFSSLKVTNVP